MTITGQSSLDKDDIDQMVKDAEAHAEEDRQRREEAEVRNKADTLVYQTEKLLKEQGDKIAGDEKTSGRGRTWPTLKSAIGGTDIEAIKTATEALMTASQELHPEALRRGGRRRPRRRGGGDGAGASQPSDDDVVDAEIVDDEQSGVGRPMADVQPERRARRRRRRGRRGRAPRRRRRRRSTPRSTVETLVADLERRHRRARRVPRRLPARRRPTSRTSASRRSDAATTRSRARPARLVERLLPVLDACDGALAHGATEVEPIAAALLGALEKEGLERVDPIGEVVRPHRRTRR